MKPVGAGLIVGDRLRFVALISIMAAMMAIVTTATLWLLYSNFIDYQRDQLSLRAQTTVGLLKGFATFDRANENTNVPSTYKLIMDVAQRGVSFGKTGEFVIVRRDRDMIEFLVASRSAAGALPDPLPFDSPRAEALRGALGDQAGTIMGLDHKGAQVLAAYQPAGGLGIGVVAKIDLVEVRAPFVRAGFIAILIAVVLTMLSAYLFRRIGNPIIARLQDFAEKEVREARETVKSMLETALEGVHAIDETGTLYFWNPAAEKITGFKSSDVIGRNYVDVLVPERYRAERRQALEQFATGTWRLAGQTVQVPVLRANGEEFTSEVSTSVFQYDGRWRAVSFFHDVTQQLQQQQALQDARDAAESATEAKSQFLAAMSHEIRTPMNGVVGMIDLMRATKLDNDQRDMLGTVRESAYALLQIINDILDLSKIEAGQMKLESTSTSVRDVVESVAQTLAPNATQKNVLLNNFTDPAIPEWVMGDPVRLRQILFNLVGNAVKFTDTTDSDFGRVELRAELVEMTESEVRVRYAVLDNGIGIPKEAQARLFQPFSQAEASTTRRFGGTGLGLSICANLVKLMGGEIELHSEPGAGSTFSATIVHGRSSRASTQAEAIDLSGITVLQVVAFGRSQEIGRRYLQYHGAVVHDVDHIDRAKEMADRLFDAGTPADVVLVGLRWTDEQVQELRAQLAAGSKFPAMRFVRMVRGRRLSVRQADQEMVMVDVVPMRRAQLLRAVATAVGRESPDIIFAPDWDEAVRTDAPSVAEAAAAGQLILVAEDNLTNQKVVRRQLNLLGYAAEIVGDGAEAMEALAQKRYALLLTDCHMPNMDGYELTKSIRAREAPLDWRLPIIALTANALQGEADRCLAVGMDDYLAKPFEIDVLRQKLKKWMPVSATAVADMPAVVARAVGQEAASVPSSQAAGPIDPRALISLFGDDQGAILDLLKEFVEPSAANVREIMAAYGRRSADGIGAGAHKLKSSSGAIGAKALSELCQRLEMAGKSEDWSEIDSVVPQLENVFSEVIDHIDAL